MEVETDLSQFLVYLVLETRVRMSPIGKINHFVKWYILHNFTSHELTFSVELDTMSHSKS